MKKIVVVSPYIGDFKTEILHFWPFINWLKQAFYENEIYVSSHINRKFLYNNINYLPINSFLSRSENRQQQWIHKDISSKDYKYLEDVYYKKIFENNIHKSEIIKIQLGYSKKTYNNISIFQKKYDNIEIEMDIKLNNTVLFIPDNIENLSFLSNIFELLSNTFSRVVIGGDTKTHLIDKNSILNKVDYFSNGYENIFKQILNSNFVVCPVGHWTYICNLLGIPCFSWGKNVSLFKEDGIYNFNNKKSFVFCYDRKNGLHNFEKMLKYFIYKNCLEE